MSYLQKKNIRGHTYYYYTVTKRIEGKSAKIQQVYLGTPGQIFEKCSSAQEPELPVRTSHLEFGLAAALYQQALELGVIPLINSYALLVAITVVSFFGSHSWLFELMSHFRLQCLCCFCCALRFTG